MLLAVLLVAFLAQGCRTTPSGVGEGPLFQAEEKAPAGKALVYVYWSPGEKGKLDQVWMTPLGFQSEEIRRGGYAALTLDPGHHRLLAMQQWDVTSSNSAGMDLGELAMEAQAGETYFVRIEEKSRFLLPRVELRPVESEAALSEIQRCRQMVEVPFTVPDGTS
jgi:hypothetical protein